MLTPDKVRPKLFDENSDVRKEALHYFSELTSPDRLTADELWRVHDQFQGATRVSEWKISKAPQSAASIRRALEAGQRREKVGFELFDLEWFIGRLPIDALETHDHLMNEHPACTPKIRKRILERLDPVRRARGREWERLETLAAESETKAYSEFPREAFDLQAVLARDPAAASARAKQYLGAENTGWMPIFAIDILGLIRDESAIELLSERVKHGYAVDSECDFENGVASLARIGTPTAVDALERLHSLGVKQFSHSAAAELGHIKTPESEQALLRLAQSSHDDTDATFLSLALMELAATEPAAWEFLRRTVEADHWDHSIDNPFGPILSFAEFVGWRPAEAERWANERDAYQQIMLERRQQFRVGPHPARPLPPLNYSTVVKAEPKVGRNDPCSCGSGKKYKKCCGK